MLQALPHCSGRAFCVWFDWDSTDSSLRCAVDDPISTTQAMQTHKMIMKGSEQTSLTLTQFKLQSEAAKKTPLRINTHDKTRA